MGGQKAERRAGIVDNQKMEHTNTVDGFPKNSLGNSQPISTLRDRIKSIQSQRAHPTPCRSDKDAWCARCMNEPQGKARLDYFNPNSRMMLSACPQRSMM